MGNESIPGFQNAYWVAPGLLLAGEYPRNRDRESSRDKLRVLLRAGIRQFVDLTEPGESSRVDPLEPYHDLVAGLAGAMGVPCAVERISIRDMTVPNARTMRRILDTIDAALRGGLPVYLHCWGGFGRTGTVVGCWLLRHRRATNTTVLETIAALRERTALAGYRSPQTLEQREFVRNWREP